MNPSNDQQSWTSSVIIRSFQPSDQSECTKIFQAGSEEITKQTGLVFLSSVSWYVVTAMLFASAAAMLWSIWIFVLYIAVIFVLAYPYIKWCYEYIKWQNSVLKKGYRNTDGCHIWVAEWNGKVVGMVRLTYNNEIYEAGIATLDNFHVVPSFRGKGIGNKLLNELIAHAKRQRIKEIVLHTSNTLTAALRLYKRNGFKVILAETAFYTKTHLDLSLQL